MSRARSPTTPTTDRNSGIEVTKDDRIGWSPTTLPAATRDAYADTSPNSDGLRLVSMRR